MATRASTNQAFGTDEILWYDNGRWGEAGYAIPNPGGKVWTVNSTIFDLHKFVGLNLFAFMHREDPQFSRPPHVQFLYDVHQMLITARKRLADLTRLDNDPNGLVAEHARPNPQVFLVYPVPFFAERIRNPDARLWCELTLLMLSEMMQHSDNERSHVITAGFSAQAGKYLQEILVRMATKYFDYTREQAYEPAFALKDEDFKKYDPTKRFTSVELVDERPPVGWWPTENDLSKIRGSALNDALVFARRWPATAWLDQADGHVDSFPQGSDTSGGSGEEQASGGFIQPAGQVPS